MAALGKPDEERPDGEVFCGGVGLIYPQILVITADGKRVVPHLPVDACDSEEAVADRYVTMALRAAGVTDAPERAARPAPTAKKTTAKKTAAAGTR